MKVTATVQRSDGWWAVEVGYGTGLSTQARRLDQVPAMVADAVALAADVDPSDVDVAVVPHLSDEDARMVQAARQAALEAAQSARRASELSRAAARRLRGEGLTVRDVGGLLGVSAQRVSQLV